MCNRKKERENTLHCLFPLRSLSEQIYPLNASQERESWSYLTTDVSHDAVQLAVHVQK